MHKLFYYDSRECNMIGGLFILLIMATAEEFFFAALTDSLQRGSLLFRTTFPETPGTHSIRGIWPQQRYHCPASGNASNMSQ